MTEEKTEPVEEQPKAEPTIEELRTQLTLRDNELTEANKREETYKAHQSGVDKRANDLDRREASLRNFDALRQEVGELKELTQAVAQDITENRSDYVEEKPQRKSHAEEVRERQVKNASAQPQSDPEATRVGAQIAYVVKKAGADLADPKFVSAGKLFEHGLYEDSLAKVEEVIKQKEEKPPELDREKIWLEIEVEKGHVKKDSAIPSGSSKRSFTAEEIGALSQKEWVDAGRPSATR